MKSRTYRTWSGMRSRCMNPNHESYASYGGRGIVVCERWNAFANFLADMGERPEGMTLDRKDNDGNYEPGNCRWADLETQRNNTSRSRRLTHNGRTLTVAQWTKELGLSKETVRCRLKRGLPVELALGPTRPSSGPLSVRHRPDDGVCWDKQAMRWRAYMEANGRTQMLGSFANKADALAARAAGLSSRVLPFQLGMNAETSATAKPRGHQVRGVFATGEIHATSHQSITPKLNLRRRLACSQPKSG